MSPTTTADLAAWLKRQIAEDERVARAGEPDHEGLWRKLGNDGFEDHILRWQPKRVLAECDAKRRIVDEYVYWTAKLTKDPKYPALTDRCDMILRVVRLIALPYSDRPGYRPEWRPE